MHRSLLIVLILMLAALPAAAQDWAKARLDKSPRHQEWVKVKDGSRDVDCFIVFPEVKEKATAVILIHEIFGLTDWVRGVADQLAEAGYIAIAPDLLSGTGPGGGGTSAYSGRDEVIRGIYSLPASQVRSDLDATAGYISKLPACNGKVVVAGFCWGGRTTFRCATENADIKAAFVFYGEGPNKLESIEKIHCPVYGFYGGNDNRVDSTIDKSKQLMKEAGKTYEPVIYEGAGHGFMRAGEAPDANAANRKAHDEAWKRWLELLKKV